MVELPALLPTEMIAQQVGVGHFWKCAFCLLYSFLSYKLIIFVSREIHLLFILAR